MYADRRVYGLSLIERLSRQCRELGFHRILLFSGMSMGNQYRISPFSEFKTFISACKKEDPSDLCFIDANCILDDRLIKFVKNLDHAVQLTPRGGFVKLGGQELLSFAAQCPEVISFSAINSFIREYVKNNQITVLNPNNFDSYIDDLRLNFVPYFFRIDQHSQMHVIENQMFEANFKGTLDFIATFVYKYPVREITKFLSRFPWVTPNMITVLSILSSFAVPLLFTMGALGWGIIVGWCMFIFDSVDGKLARLTIRLSSAMGVIEHVTSAPAIFFWFAGLAWYFSEGKLLDFGNPSTMAGWTLMLLYWLDKGINAIFKPRFKIDLYNYSPLDRFFHLIACRRAIILFIVTIGYAFNDDRNGFFYLAFWMVVSFLFHLFRLLWIITTRKLVRPK